MVSTSGSQLLPEKAVKELRTKLLPLTTILTPNIPEAQLLLKDSGADVPEPTNRDELIQLARRICSLGPKAVLLKGGHLPLTKDHKTAKTPEEATTVVDILFDGKSVTLFETEYLVSPNTHGTGCSLASAIAANLAKGKNMTRAVRGAVRFVEAGIKTSVDLGKGSGPINHFHSIYTMPFAPYVTYPRGNPTAGAGTNRITSSGRFLEYILDRSDVQRVWERFTYHEFVEGIGQGTLPLERFKEYLVQDYLYLVKTSIFFLADGEIFLLIVSLCAGPICPKQRISIVQGQEYGFNSSGR